MGIDGSTSVDVDAIVSTEVESTPSTDVEGTPVNVGNRSNSKEMPNHWKHFVELAFARLSLPAGAACVPAFSAGMKSSSSVPKVIIPIPTAAEKKTGRDAQRRAEFESFRNMKINQRNDVVRLVSTREIIELNHSNALDEHRQKIMKARGAYDLAKEIDSPSGVNKRLCLEALQAVYKEPLPTKEIIDLTQK